MTNLDKIDPVLIRVARVLAMSQGSSEWVDFVEPAQAMLRALREPSLEMLEAGALGMPDFGELPDGWRAMIDHVIGQEPQQFNDNAATAKVSKAAS